MAKLAFPRRRRTDWRPSLWILFWMCLSAFLTAELMSVEKPVRMYYPFTISLEGSANDINE